MAIVTEELAAVHADYWADYMRAACGLPADCMRAARGKIQRYGRHGRGLLPKCSGGWTSDRGVVQVISWLVSGRLAWRPAFAAAGW